MKSILSSLSLLVFSTAFGSTIETRPGDKIDIAIPVSGAATVAFPEPVKAISGAQNFKLSVVGAERDERSGQVVNPQVFSISAILQSADETVTFVFPPKNGAARMLSVHLRVSASAPNAYQIRFQNLQSVSAFKGFLSAETTMMAAMIRDDEAFGKQVTNTQVQIKNADTLQCTLVRKFESGGLGGFVLSAKNKTADALKVNLNALRLGTDSQPVMAHVEREVLLPCGKAKTACDAKIYLIVRNGELQTGLESSSNFPFVKTAKE